MFDIFKNYGIIAEVSERKDGSMKIYPDSSEEREVKRNRKIFLRKLGVETENSVVAFLAHSDRISLVKKGDGGKFFESTDGFVTKDKNIFLTVTVSDCLPVFLFDPKIGAIGLAHAGWGGLEKGIIANMISQMKKIGSDPQNILVAIGPGMEKCHYEIGEELVEKFSHIPGSFERRQEKFFLDTKAIAAYLLSTEGVLKKNMEISKECTFREKEKYFSYRRDSYGNPHKLEAMIAVIGMRN